MRVNISNVKLMFIHFWTPQINVGCEGVEFRERMVESCRKDMIYFNFPLGSGMYIYIIHIYRCSHWYSLRPNFAL